jgi:hypothetical protein
VPERWCSRGTPLGVAPKSVVQCNSRDRPIPRSLQKSQDLQDLAARPTAEASLMVMWNKAEMAEVWHSRNQCCRASFAERSSVRQACAGGAGRLVRIPGVLSPEILAKSKKIGDFGISNPKFWLSRKPAPIRIDGQKQAVPLRRRVRADFPVGAYSSAVFGNTMFAARSTIDGGQNSCADPPDREPDRDPPSRAREPDESSA